MTTQRNQRLLRAAAVFFLFSLFCLAFGVTNSLAADDSSLQEVDAEESADSTESELESFYATTTVTATGRETDSFRLPTPVTVIERKTIEERAPGTATDLLRFEPGVDVSGVGANQPRPVIRGQRGLRILFLENGLRMNNSRRQTDFGETVALVDVENVETVEVVRGPASVLYGSDAVGGVLNLITRVPTAGSGYSGGLDLRASSADEQVRARAHATGRSEQWSWSLGYSYRDSEDYEAPAGSFGDLTLDRDATVNDTGVQDDSGDAYLGYRPSDRHAFFARYNRYRADDTGFGFVEPELLGDSEDFRIQIVYPFQRFDKLTFGYQGSGLGTPVADTANIQIYHQDNERQLANDIDINIGPIFRGAPDSSVESDTLNFTDLQTTGLRAELTKVAGDNQVWTYGLEAWEDDSVNTDFSTTTTTIRFPFPPFASTSVSTDSVANAPNATHTSWGLFAQDEINLGDKFSAILGARYQDVETRAEATPGWDITGLDFSDDSFVGSVNLLYALTEKVHLVGSWGTAFRAPNIVERLFNGLTPEGAGFQILNPNLESEESENIDIGVKYQNRNGYLEVFYFENDIDKGVIQYFLTPAEIAQLPAATQEQVSQSGVSFVVQQRNLDRLTFEGVEVAGAYRFENGVSLGGNFSWLEGRRVDSTNPPTGDSYGEKANIFLRYDPVGSPWRAEYRVRHNGAEDIFLTAGEPAPLFGPELPSFTIHSLYGGYSFDAMGSEHQIGVVVDNLTDELYAEFSNASFFRPEPGRNAVLTYRLGF